MIRWLGNRFAMITALLVLFYLFLPVAYTFVFSFNNYKKSNITWNPEGSPTLKHWKDPCGAPGVCESLVVSLQVGVIATLVATVLGTLLAFAWCGTGSGAAARATSCCFVPMATPEIVLGASLLTIFVQGFSNVGLRLGFSTIVIAHIMFCHQLRRRHRQGSPAEPGPAPRGGRPGPVCRAGQHVLEDHFPLVAPGHRRRRTARVLAVLRRLHHHELRLRQRDDTFPKFVYVSYLRGIPAQANVIGFSMFVIALALVIGGQLVGNARKK